MMVAQLASSAAGCSDVEKVGPMAWTMVCYSVLYSDDSLAAATGEKTGGCRVGGTVAKTDEKKAAAKAAT